MADVTALNLTRLSEDEWLGQNPFARPSTAVIIVAGPLGSGKTTLIRSLLEQARAAGLRAAALANEAASVDIDTQLLGSDDRAAATGVPSTAGALAGGCSCCPAGLARLHAALDRALDGTTVPLDYLLLETSGLADPRPLAAALASRGARLSLVIAVAAADGDWATGTTPGDDPGARAMRASLASAATAADILVLNRCDAVSSLKDLSRAEAALVQLAAMGTGQQPVTLLRTRFGVMPAGAVMDSPGGGTPKGRGVVAAGMLSHESSLGPSGRLPPRTTPRPPPRSLTAAAAPCGAHDCAGVGVHTMTWEGDGALRLVRFAAWASGPLRSTPGLLRAKGILHFTEAPSHRVSFHLVGRSRAVAVRCLPGGWRGPRRTQIIAIGVDAAALAATVSQLQALADDGRSPDSGGDVDVASAAAAALAADARFESVIAVGPLVRCSLRGAPAHGVEAADMNRELEARAADDGLVMLAAERPGGGRAAPGALDWVAWVPGVGGSALDRVLEIGAAVHARAMAHVHAGCVCGR